MLEILPSISAGSDKPRNGLISKVEGGNSSSGGVWARFLLFWPTLLALGWPSWACFKCCFILSGRENSFWQIEHGKTLRAAPSWYKKACLWKLYLFLKCLLICTRSHSTHLERRSDKRHLESLFPNLESRLQSIHTMWKSQFLSKNCIWINLPKSKLTKGQSYPRTKLPKGKVTQGQSCQRVKLPKGKVTKGKVTKGQRY